MAPRAVDWHTRFVERDMGYATPCRIWTGARESGRYGVVRIGGKRCPVHRLVWAEAHGDPGVLHVLHHCDVGLCGRLDHLFLGTHGDNMRDLAAKGYRRAPDTRGAANGSAKLTEVDIRAIRASAAPLATLSARYGVSASSISMIRNRKTWRHVD